MGALLTVMPPTGVTSDKRATGGASIHRDRSARGRNRPALVHCGRAGARAEGCVGRGVGRTEGHVAERAEKRRARGRVGGRAGQLAVARQEAHSFFVGRFFAQVGTVERREAGRGSSARHAGIGSAQPARSRRVAGVERSGIKVAAHSAGNLLVVGVEAAGVAALGRRVHSVGGGLGV